MILEHWAWIIDYSKQQFQWKYFWLVCISWDWVCKIFKGKLTDTAKNKQGVIEKFILIVPICLLNIPQRPLISLSTFHTTNRVKFPGPITRFSTNYTPLLFRFLLQLYTHLINKRPHKSSHIPFNDLRFCHRTGGFHALEYKMEHLIESCFGGELVYLIFCSNVYMITWAESFE